MAIPKVPARMREIHQKLTSLGATTWEYFDSFSPKRNVHVIVKNNVDEEAIREYTNKAFDKRYFVVSILKESERDLDRQLDVDM